MQLEAISSRFLLLSELMIDFWMDTGVLHIPLPVRLIFTMFKFINIATSINALCFFAVPCNAIRKAHLRCQLQIRIFLLHLLTVNSLEILNSSTVQSIFITPEEVASSMCLCLMFSMCEYKYDYFTEPKLHFFLMINKY